MKLNNKIKKTILIATIMFLTLSIHVQFVIPEMMNYADFTKGRFMFSIIGILITAIAIKLIEKIQKAK